jgi:hypothetical protein
VHDPPGIGHNRGPLLDPEKGWRLYCWKKAHKAAWKTPPREIALARLERARALGMTYRECAPLTYLAKTRHART